MAIGEIMYGVILIGYDGKWTILPGKYKHYNNAKLKAIQSGYTDYIITFTQNGLTKFIRNTKGE